MIYSSPIRHSPHKTELFYERYTMIYSRFTLNYSARNNKGGVLLNIYENRITFYLRIIIDFKMNILRNIINFVPLLQIEATRS